jgi:hypothetical protein
MALLFNLPLHLSQLGLQSLNLLPQAVYVCHAVAQFSLERVRSVSLLV